MAISKSELVAELLKEFPELQESWAEHLKWMEHIGKPRDIELDVFIIGTKLRHLQMEGNAHLYPRWFAFIERVFIEGEPEAHAIVDQKFLGQFARIARRGNPKFFETWMGPETKRRWNELLQRQAQDPDIQKRARRRKERGRLREYIVTLKECPSGESAIPLNYPNAGLKTKLGGDPNWVQGDERPECRCCGQPMTFVAQIDSIEHRENNNLHGKSPPDREWMFGDVGMIYVFFCFGCLATRGVFQCH